MTQMNSKAMAQKSQKYQFLKKKKRRMSTQKKKRSFSYLHSNSFILHSCTILCYLIWSQHYGLKQSNQDSHDYHGQKSISNYPFMKIKAGVEGGIGLPGDDEAKPDFCTRQMQVMNLLVFAKTKSHRYGHQIRSCDIEEQERQNSLKKIP